MAPSDVGDLVWSPASGADAQLPAKKRGGGAVDRRGARSRKFRAAKAPSLSALFATLVQKHPRPQTPNAPIGFKPAFCFNQESVVVVF